MRLLKHSCCYFYASLLLPIVATDGLSQNACGQRERNGRSLQTRWAASNDLYGACEDTRRSLLQRSVASFLLPFVAVVPQEPAAALAAPTSTTTAPADVSPTDAVITHKVFMNVRVSRQDGTFYVRDDLPDTPENRVFTGRLVMALFGKNAPTHVERFLEYIQSVDKPEDDTPSPNYSRSTFTSVDPVTGLLQGGVIPSLEVTEIGGSTALRYGGRIKPASLWVERQSTAPRISHTTKGLLTHRRLDVTPVFGITTRTDTRELDRSHTVFGAVLLNQGDGSDFINLVRDLPTYSVERPVSMIDPLAETLVDDAAQAIFNAQRDFFRSAAKTLGDARLDKIYTGKLLRRVEVTQVGML